MVPWSFIEKVTEGPGVASDYLYDNGTRQTVLIDWESLGPGPVGADLASLLFSSARRGDLSARALPALLSEATNNYAHGLAEMGALIAPDDLRLGLFASISLRWTLVRDVVRILDGQSPARRESAPEESEAEALDELIALTEVLLDSAGTAWSLLSG